MNVRRRVSQLCAVVAAAAMFLTWQTGASGADETVQGTTTSEGQLVLIAGLVTAGLVQVGWRPAWIGAGLIVATTLRAAFDSEADPGVGLLIALLAGIIAAALLIWDMFENVSAQQSDGRGGGSRGRGMSGPLGRRRR